LLNIAKYVFLNKLTDRFQADHADYDKIREALDAMRNVAVLINERKRRMESLEKLAAWQQRVEAWEVSHCQLWKDTDHTPTIQNPFSIYDQGITIVADDNRHSPHFLIVCQVHVNFLTLLQLNAFTLMLSWF
jgi:hypothetical protein